MFLYVGRSLSEYSNRDCILNGDFAKFKNSPDKKSFPLHQNMTAYTIDIWKGIVFTIMGHAFMIMHVHYITCTTLYKVSYKKIPRTMQVHHYALHRQSTEEIITSINAL